MSNNVEKNGLSWGMWCGIVASFLYAAVAIFFIWNNQINGTALELNEVGDYLAGAFSPLAFLWLVIGYLMQNSELKLSRESIKRQADELEAATNIQVKRERRIFDSNQPIIEITLVKVEHQSSISINFRNTGCKATNAIFTSDLMYGNALAEIDINKGSNRVDLFYYDLRNKIKSLNLPENIKQTLDILSIDYVDGSSLQQRSQLKIDITKLPTDEVEFSIELQQYFEGELID